MDRITLELNLNTSKFNAQLKSAVSKAQKTASVNVGVRASGQGSTSGISRANSGQGSTSFKLPTPIINFDTKSIVSELKAIKANTRGGNLVTKVLSMGLSTLSASVGLIGKATSTVVSKTVGTAIDSMVFTLSKGFTKSVMEQRRLDPNTGEKSVKTVEHFAKQISDLTSKASKEYAELLFGVNKDLPNAVEIAMKDVVDVIKHVVSPQQLADSFGATRKYYFNQKSKIETGSQTASGVANDLGEKAFDANPRFVRNLLYRALQLSAMPARVRKEENNARLARVVEKAVDYPGQAEKIVGKAAKATGAAIEEFGEKITKINFLMGGFQNEKGNSGNQLVEQMKGFFDENTLLVPIKNPDTDSNYGDKTSSLFEEFKSIAASAGLDLPGEIKSTLANFETILSQVARGENSDAVRASIMAAAFKKVYGNKVDVGALGFSGAGQPLEQMVSILEQVGIDIKALTLGTPFFGLTDTASPENFKSLMGVGKNVYGKASSMVADEQSAMYDKDFLKGEGFVESIVDKLGDKTDEGIPTKLLDKMFLKPGRQMVNVDDPSTHSVPNYVKRDEFINELRKLPGFRTIDNSKIDVKTLSKDFRELHKEAIELAGDLEDLSLGTAKSRVAMVEMGKQAHLASDSSLIKNGRDLRDAVLEGKLNPDSRDYQLANRSLGNASEATMLFKKFEGELFEKIQGQADKKAEKVTKYENNPELSKEENEAAKKALIEQNKKILGDMYIALFKEGKFYQGAMAKLATGQAYAKRNAERIAKEKGEDFTTFSKGLSDIQVVDAASLNNKRINDDAHVLRTLNNHLGRPTDEGYQFFNEEQGARKLLIELQGGLIKYVTDPIAQSLEGTKFEQTAKKYNQLLNTMSAGLARYMVTGEKLPEAFVDAATKILTMEDKLADFEVPTIEGLTGIGEKAFETTYKKKLEALDKGSKKPKEVDNSLNEQDLKEIANFNKIAIEQNKNKQGSKIPYINIANVEKIGEGQNGVALLDKATNRIIKYQKENFESQLTRLTNTAIGTAQQVILGGKKTVIKDVAKDLAEQREGVVGIGAFEQEQKNTQRVVDAGLAGKGARSQSQLEGYLVTQLVKGQTLASKAKVLNDGTEQEIEEFIKSLVKVGRVMSDFHKKQMTHNDLHLGNVMQDESGNLTPIDFGSVQSLKREDIASELDIQDEGSGSVQIDREVKKRIKDDFNRAVNHSLGLLAGKGININPELLRTALRLGLKQGGNPGNSGASVGNPESPKTPTPSGYAAKLKDVVEDFWADTLESGKEALQSAKDVAIEAAKNAVCKTQEAVEDFWEDVTYDTPQFGKVRKNRTESLATPNQGRDIDDTMEFVTNTAPKKPIKPQGGATAQLAPVSPEKQLAEKFKGNVTVQSKSTGQSKASEKKPQETFDKGIKTDNLLSLTIVGNKTLSDILKVEKDVVTASTSGLKDLLSVSKDSDNKLGEVVGLLTTTNTPQEIKAERKQELSEKFGRKENQVKSKFRDLGKANTTQENKDTLVKSPAFTVSNQHLAGIKSITKSIDSRMAEMVTILVDATEVKEEPSGKDSKDDIETSRVTKLNSEGFREASSNTFKSLAGKAARDYGRLKGLEDAVAALIPGLKQVINTTKAIAPYVATGVAVAALPGGAGIQAIEGLAQAAHNAAPAIDALANGAGSLAGNIASAIGNSATANIAGELGGVAGNVAGSLGGAATSAISTAVEAGVTTGISVAGDIAIAAAPLIVATKTVKSGFKAFSKKADEMGFSHKQIAASQEKASYSLLYAADTIKSVKDKYVQVTQEPYFAGKKLPAKQQKEFNKLPQAEQVKILDAQARKVQNLLNEADRGIVSGRNSGDSKVVSQAMQAKKTLVDALTKIQGKMRSLGEDVTYQIDKTKDSVKKAQERIRQTPINLSQKPKGTTQVVSKVDDVIGKSGKKAKQVEYVEVDVRMGGQKSTQHTKAMELDAESKGEDLADGYAQGIKKNAKKASKASYDMANDAVDGIAKGQNSASPSKDAVEKGEDLGDGYVIGIIKKIKAAVKAAKGMAQSAIGGLIPKEVGFSKIFKTNTRGIVGQATEKGQAMQAALPLKSIDGLLEKLMGEFPQFGRIANFALGKIAGSEGAQKVKMALLGAFPLVGLIAFRQQIDQTIRELVRFKSETETIANRLNATGVSSSRDTIFKQFSKDATEAGLRVEDYTNTLASLGAATKGKVASPSQLTKDITLGLKQRGVTGEASNRALVGIQQIASKGVVSMEELRQQISEALPGAMSIAAESMGMTERQFNKMVSSGQIMSSEFLPKFADSLKTGAKGAGGLNTEVANLQNSFGQLKESVVSTSVLAGGVKVLSLAIQGLAAIAPALGFTMLALTGLFIKSATSIILASKALTAFSLASLKAIGIVSGMIVGFMALGGIIGSVTNNASKDIRDLGKELDRINTKLTEPKENKSFSFSMRNAGEEELRIANQYQGAGFLDSLTTGGKYKAAVAATKALVDNVEKLNKLQADNLFSSEDVDTFRAKSLDTLKQIQDMRYRANNQDLFGLTTTEAQRLQQEAQKLEDEIKLEFEATFKIEEKERIVSALEKQLGKINEEIESGNDSALNLKLRSQVELDLDTAKNQLSELKQALTIVSTVQPLVKTANALNASKDSKLAQFNTEKEMQIYSQMLKDGASSRVAEIRVRKLGVEAKQEELRLTKEIIKAQEDSILSMSASQISALEKLLETNIGNADAGAISKARTNVEQQEKMGFKLDDDVLSNLNVLESQIQNRQKVSELNKEQIKEQFELKSAIRELKVEIRGLALEARNRAIEFARFGLEGKRFKEDRVNPIKFNALDTSRQLNQSVRSQTLAYTQAVEGIQDFNYGIQSAVKDLALKMVNVAREMQNAAINGVNAFLGSANLDDLFGFGKIRDVISKGIGITQSDTRPQLDREIADTNRQFSIEQRGQQRSLDQLILDTQNQIYENSRRQQENSIARSRAKDDVGLDIESLMVRALELEKSKEDTNRSIRQANDAAKEYGINDRASLITANVPSLDGLDLEEAIAEVDKYHAVLDRAYSDTNALLNRISSEGSSNIKREMAESQSLHKQRMEAKEAEKRLEGERVAQARQLLAQELKGTLIGISQGLVSNVRTLKNELQSLKDSLTEFYNTSGLQGSMDEQLQAVGNKKLLEVESKISEIDAAKKKLEAYKQATTFDKAGLGEVMNFIDTNRDTLTPEVADSLKGAAMAIEKSGDYQELKELIDLAIREYENAGNKLEGNKMVIAQAAVDRFAREHNRKQEDAVNATDRVAVESSYNYGDDEKARILAQLDYEKERLDIQRQFEDAVANGTAPEVAKKLADELQRASDIKYNRTVKELSGVKKYLEMARQPLESFFNGVGDSLGKSLAGTFDKEQLQNKLNEVNADFGNELLELQEKYADDPAKLQEATERLQMLNGIKLDNVKNEFNVLGEIVKGLTNTVLEFGKAVAQAFIKKGVDAAINGILGGGGIKLFADGGEVENYASGGTIGVGNYMKAYNKEKQLSGGKQPVPIMAHKGEQILSTLNGDAQFFRKLQANGSWDDLKNGGMANFANGGTVGGANYAYGGTVNRGMSSNQSNTNVNTYVTVHAKDVNSFYRSKSQVAANTSQGLEMAARRNG